MMQTAALADLLAGWIQDPAYRLAAAEAVLDAVAGDVIVVQCDGHGTEADTLHAALSTAEDQRDEARAALAARLVDPHALSMRDELTKAEADAYVAAAGPEREVRPVYLEDLEDPTDVEAERDELRRHFDRLVADLVRLREDVADEADWIAQHGGMISAAWVAAKLQHLADHGHRSPREGEGTHVHPSFCTEGPNRLEADR